MQMARVFTQLMQLRLSPDQERAVAALAAEEQRPVSVMARLLIERGLSMTDLRNNTAIKVRKARAAK